VSVEVVCVQTLTPEELITHSARLEEKITLLEAKVSWFEEQFKLVRARQFGASSERMESASQGELVFNEAEAALDSPCEAVESETITYTRSRKSAGHRQQMLAELPTEVREYRLPEDEQVCSACGGHMHEMSTQTREELEIIPAQVRVIRHVRYVYGCRHCDKSEIEVPIVTAEAPKALIPKSLASASAIAYVMSEKFVESMPLYRLEKHFERLGVELPRQVLSNWIIKGGEMLEVIYDRMRERLLELSILHADETTLQVLHESGRPAQSKSYMWLYRSGRDGPPIVCYEYQPTRECEHARRFLTGFAGHLHADGYAGYNDLPDVTLVGCWAHARRKFTDAAKVLPKPVLSGAEGSRRNDPSHMVNIALRHINKLFEIEGTIRDASADERKAARYGRSRPVVEEFKRWLDSAASKVLPKSALGEALTYCRNQWPKLIVFLEDGRLELDNNRAERSIKPFVIGRKNWLFANTARGARVSAVVYSIVETAKENGLDPCAYLKYLFDRLPGIPRDNADALDSLLPWSEPIRSALQRQPTPPLTAPQPS
jgi:transposase